MKSSALARLAQALVVAVLLFAEHSAFAKTKYYGIAIGNNAAPAVSGRDDALSALQFADDDAASMTQFLDELGADTALLTVMDADTQRRFPSLASRAQVPSLAELRRVVARDAALFEQDRQAGVDPVLVLYFSGHGVQGAGEQSFLNMLDGPLTQALLYDEFLPHLSAKYLHLIVDACHAESIVRPRDLNLSLSAVTADDRAQYQARWTLARFPQVGALIASTASAQAQEWDRYRQGVFTHEILSGLRGAADVNGDGRVEYSELEAFLAAANRGVQDERARASVVVHAPTINARAAIVDLSSPRNGATLANLSGALGRVYIEDDFGNPVLEMFGETRFAPDVAVPANRRLFVHSALGELALRPRSGERIVVRSGEFQHTSVAARGAMESSLLLGLYATAFGPRYYQGYVDARGDLVPVPADTRGDAAPPLEGRPARSIGAPIAFVSAGALLVASLGFGIDAAHAAHLYDSTSLERPASEARARFQRDRAISLLAGGGGAIAAGVGLWLELTPHSNNWTRLGFGSELGEVSLQRAW